MVEISAATAADAPALVSLRAAVARDMTQQYGKGQWSTMPSKSVVLRQLRASRVLVAREGGQVLGSVRLATPNVPAIEAGGFTAVDSALYMLGLAVAPNARERGIARALVEAAKEIVRGQSIQALWLDVYDHAAGAGPFYRKCGFRAVGGTRDGEVPLVYYEWLTV
jgi:L-amino acid N-acyltransferase